MKRPWHEQPRTFVLVFGLTLIAGLIPLWSVQHVPAVDLPEHLFLIHVLQTVNDTGSFYSSEYVSKPGLTYLTFYYSVRTLAGLTGAETAMKVWLTLVLAGIPLSLAVLLKALGRSPWLALLAVPLMYTDNFYWGLVSFISSIPFVFLTLAYFLRALEEKPSRRSTVILLASSLVLLQLTHAAGVIFPALALPVLFFSTPSDRQRRVRALVAVSPGVFLFLCWLLVGVHSGRQLGATNDVRTAPLFDSQNFDFTPLSERLAKIWTPLADGFKDGADRPPLVVWTILMLAVLAAAFSKRKPAKLSWYRYRPELLLGVAVACYLLLPTNILGYMYQIYPRYMQLAALLAIGCLSLPTGRVTQLFIPAAAALALYFGVVLTPLFRAVDQEAASFETVAAHVAPHSRIMHLVMDRGGGVSTYPIYLHYAALAALRTDSIPSFSLALDPSFPVGYRHGRPPAPASEWQPAPFSWDEHARHYDYFLARGRMPVSADIFEAHAGDVDLVAAAERWTLFHKHGGAE